MNRGVKGGLYTEILRMECKKRAHTPTGGGGGGGGGGRLSSDVEELSSRFVWS